MKIYRRIISILCAISMCIPLVSTAFAANNLPCVSINELASTYEVSPLSLGNNEAAMLRQFESMSVKELNTYISNLANSGQLYAEQNVESQSYTSPWTLAWLAAAVILIKQGFACTGTILKYSIAGDDYSETNGPFSEKIKNTSVFQAWLPVRNETRIKFEINDSPDLFFSLHDVGITSPHSTTWGQVIRVSDVFDFSLEAKFDSVIVQYINDSGWLLQNMGVLKPISFTSIFTA